MPWGPPTVTYTTTRGAWYDRLPMSLPEADPKLLPVEMALGLTTWDSDIPRTRRIYVNRNLKMKDVELIGFDMDYTLALYNQAEMERLSIQLTLGKLVEKRGYPRAILDLEYAPNWATRGLVVDRPNGNIFKMDRHGHVGRCYHGRRALTHDERAALYRKERIRLSQPRYAWIDTLFALPEAVMYLNLVEFLDARVDKPEAPLDYSKLWQDVRECIDEAHRDDSLKSVIRADIGKYIVADPDLPATLHKLRSSGKRLFLLTNSLWDYTDPVMRFLFDSAKHGFAGYTSCRSYFDIIIVGGPSRRSSPRRTPSSRSIRTPARRSASPRASFIAGASIRPATSSASRRWHAPAAIASSISAITSTATSCAPRSRASGAPR